MIWICMIMQKINIGKLLSKQFKDGRFQRYDAIAKYLFIDEFMADGCKDDFEFDLYKDMAEARGRKGKRKSFIKVIKSFLKDGFISDYPLIVKANFYMCGGSHRLACCMWFDIKEIPMQFHDGDKNKKELFSELWIKNNGINKYWDKIEKTKNILFEKFKVDEYN